MAGVSSVVFDDTNGNIESVIARIDSRVKFLWTVAVMGLLAFILDPVVYAGITLYLVILLAVARIRIREIARDLRAFLLLFLLTFILHILFTPSVGDVLFKVWRVEVTDEGIYRGALYSYRVLLFLLVMSVSARTTTSIEMADGIMRLIKPFRKIGVPVGDISMMIFVALRFIPLLREEAGMIRLAQISRGMTMGRGLFGRIRSSIPIIVPLMLGALRRAESLALAVESRGYRRGTIRTSMIEFKLGRSDFIFAISGICVIASCFVITEFVV